MASNKLTSKSKSKSKKYTLRKKNNKKRTLKRRGGTTNTSEEVKVLTQQAKKLEDKFDTLADVIDENQDSKPGVKELVSNANELQDKMSKLEQEVENIEEKKSQVTPIEVKTVKENIKDLNTSVDNLEKKAEKVIADTVTVKIYPNNGPNSKEIVLGDYRVVVDKKIPSDLNTVEHFLTNTMKYIKSHSNKVQSKFADDDDTVFFPHTEFKYVFSPNKNA